MKNQTSVNKFNEIKAAFEKLRNQQNAEKMAAYMRHKFSFYGIPATLRKAIYKDLLKVEKKSGNIDREFLKLCWDNAFREFQYVVIDYLDAMHNSLKFDDVPFIETFIRSKQWWDSIDGLDTIVGKIAYTDSRVSNLMLTWARDDDFWVRRVAIDHQLGRKEKTDAELLEKIIVANFGSNEFFINKAIGWSLRDYSKTNPDRVRRFIEKHRDKMSPLSIREASKYIK